MMETEQVEEAPAHHRQHELCVTRAPYRQGRRLTAVKVYSIAKESNHLLIFGVPSLNLRQEAKALFIKFGKLLQFNQSKDHPAEAFTETYRASYESIHSARIAKKMLDTKNFYGGSLHVCYAPEFESINETRLKLTQRQKDVTFRLRNLQNKDKQEIVGEKSVVTEEIVDDTKKLVNMGEVNVIYAGMDKICKRKVNCKDESTKRFKPCFIDRDIDSNNSFVNNINENNTFPVKMMGNVEKDLSVEIVDCTSVDRSVISNINEGLNCKFGEEAVFKTNPKPVNKIKFHLNKKSLICVMFYFKIVDFSNN